MLLLMKKQNENQGGQMLLEELEQDLEDILFQMKQIQDKVYRLVHNKNGEISDGLNYQYREDFYFLDYLREMITNPEDLFLLMGCNLFSRTEREIEDLLEKYRRDSIGYLEDIRKHQFWNYIFQEKSITNKKMQRLFRVKESTASTLLNRFVKLKHSPVPLRKYQEEGINIIEIEEKKHD